MGQFLQTDPMSKELDIAYYSAIKDEDSVVESEALKIFDWSNFFGETGHSLWNVASLGTLNRVGSQDNLGTLAGFGESTFYAGRSFSNTLTLGLQDSIYEIQMEEGAGLESIWKGTKQAAIDLTPIEEIKTVFDKDADLCEKLSAFCMTVSKVAGYAAGLKTAEPIIRSKFQLFKEYTNYKITHYFNNSIKLESDTIYYSFKNSNHFKTGTEFGKLDLLMTPEQILADEAIQKLALPYSSGYDLTLKVKMPKGSSVLKPRKVWKLYGKKGEGFETRNITPITSDMYDIINLIGD